MLLAVGVVVLGLAALGAVIALGLPRPTPFAERNLLTARLWWIGRTLWAAALIAVGGYFGAIIATDLASPVLNSTGRVEGYLIAAVLAVVVLASYGVVLPIATVMGIELVRAGQEARGDALRNASGGRALTASWVEHLSRPQYAWAALVALALTWLCQLDSGPRDGLIQDQLALSPSLSGFRGRAGKPRPPVWLAAAVLAELGRANRGVAAIHERDTSFRGV